MQSENSIANTDLPWPIGKETCLIVSFLVYFKTILSSSRKYPIFTSPLRRDNWNFLEGGVGGSIRPQKMKNYRNLNWNS